MDMLLVDDILVFSWLDTIPMDVYNCDLNISILEHIILSAYAILVLYILF